MSSTIQVVHICDHNIKEKQILSNVKDIQRSANSDIDVIDNAITITRINQVKNDSDTFLNKVDFQLYGADKIQWVGIFYPPADSIYTVDYDYYKYNQLTYAKDDCPRCGGNGWYMGLLTDGVQKMKTATGIYKVAQDYLKTLLTEKTDSGYGTTIMSIIGSNISDVSGMTADIASAVRDAESQCKVNQASLIMNGADLPDSERLYKINIDRIEVTDNHGFVIDLTLYNNENKSVNLVYKQ